MTRKSPTFRPQLEALEERCMPSYSAVASYPVDTAPQAVVTADVNGDGKLDLITANLGAYNSTTGAYDGGGVSVLLGLVNNKGVATGTFGAAVNYAVGSARSVAVGDFNGDGKTDIATGSGGVLLNNGNGTFRTGPSYASGLVTYVTAADVNGDGKLDLITASLVQELRYSGNSTIGVLVGNGDGTFRAGATYATPSSLVAVTVGNFNGKLDIITGTQYAGTTTLSLLPGNADGTFGTAQTIASLPQCDLEGLAVGDFNRDGKLDLAYATYFTGPSNGWDNSATILLGNGNGTFGYGGGGTFNYISRSQFPVSLAAADVNGDGKLDLIMVGSFNSGSYVDILTGNGTGGFGGELAYPDYGHSTPMAIAVGDFNCDGYADLALAAGSSSGGYDVDVLLWNSKNNAH